MCDRLQMGSATTGGARKDNSRPSYTLKLRGGGLIRISKEMAVLVRLARVL